MRELWELILATAVIFGVVVVVAYFVEKTSCHAKWGTSGMAVKYSLFGRCQVQLKDGRWMPADSVRNLD